MENRYNYGRDTKHISCIIITNNKVSIISNWLAAKDAIGQNSGETSCMVLSTCKYINISSRDYKKVTFLVVSPPDLILLAV